MKRHVAMTSAQIGNRCRWLVLAGVFAVALVTILAPLPAPAAQGAGPPTMGFKCDDTGVCYCTGGKNSADCKALANDPRCGSKVGCDKLGRCFCAPPKPKPIRR
jgi:hypothetical protein